MMSVMTCQPCRLLNGDCTHLQGLELFDKLWAENVNSGTELLTNFDESWAQLDQPFPHPFCQPNFALSYSVWCHSLHISHSN